MYALSSADVEGNCWMLCLFYRESGNRKQANGDIILTHIHIFSQPASHKYRNRFIFTYIMCVCFWLNEV